MRGPGLNQHDSPESELLIARKYRFAAVGLLGFVALVSGGWLQQSPNRPGPDTMSRSRLFDEIVSHVAQYYVDSLSEADLYDMAIDGMLAQLNDPYTNFLREAEYRDLTISTTGNYGGIGISIETKDGWVTVVTTFADKPGERAGIRPGDQIAEINGASARGWTARRASQLLRGEAGTPVTVGIRRAGVRDQLAFTLTRERIHVSSVDGAMMLRPGVGYLKLVSVTDVSAGEMSGALAQLESQGAQSLILDLRGNPGGVLNQGVALADLFLDSGAVVVETRGRAPGATRTYRASQPQRWKTMKLVVLVNGFTASAAEILSGALQDHDRALVIGTPSFGKGVAYIVFPLTDKEAVSVTSSRWYTPVGRSIDRSRERSRHPSVASQAADSAGDTARDSVHYSFGGRLLGGGGGIQPDIQLPDTLSESEQDFARTMGTAVQDYLNAVTQYARELQGQNRITSPEFRVTRTMLRELLERVRDRGIEMPDSMWTRAGSLIARQLGWELARYNFGREVELRRRASDDIQVQRAIELLTQSRTMSDLLALADSP